ncbi:hypothetical protein QQS21_002821 [Conoideocrella luteorostrata]|uniref:Dipeptidyl peptidase III n=1 Tax=Conoideocrella luteorostrata TaxID=1105319 RepID=A0AAJ0CUE6_9HYPO|nr:hypothetical protein QQS21_002821 [Conoideocrella luteorostrata]
MAALLLSRHRAPTHQLAIKELFEALSFREKLYAHHLARAAWNGSRVILRQTSPEGPDILDFILELHKACGGKWDKLAQQQEVTLDEVEAFLEFAGSFLSGLGNYFADGDQKVVPPISADALRKMANGSPQSATALEKIIEPLLAMYPSSLGFPNKDNQSNYYPGENQITKEEIAAVARVMEKNSIEPENTRVRKCCDETNISFNLLQASLKTNDKRRELLGHALGATVRLEPGDHAAEMSKICFHLREATKYVSNSKQAEVLAGYIECFSTGSLEAYRKAQKFWVADISPRVETILGFVEPYRDPYGVRAEWEGVVCISDPDETHKLKALVDRSTEFIRMLPWAVPGDNDGKGPFEADLFQAPDFTIVHSLAFCSSYIWEAVNLPNYSDIRETCGSKNIVFANRMSLNNNRSRPCHFERLPVNPLTTNPIETWYRPGQTWTSVFEKLATSVEECRAMLVSYYLSDNKEVLDIFGYNNTSLITADDLIYYTYMHIGVEGIQALRTFNVRDNIWGQPHARANFAILKYLLLHGDGVLTVTHDAQAETVHVTVDFSKVTSHGRPSLGRMLCCIHVWRCIADVESCRHFYEPLSAVDGEYETWRRIVASKPEPGWKFVQPNTMLGEDGKVELTVYEESNVGIIQSFLDRQI